MPVLVLIILSSSSSPRYSRNTLYRVRKYTSSGDLLAKMVSSWATTRDFTSLVASGFDHIESNHFRRLSVSAGVVKQVFISYPSEGTAPSPADVNGELP